MTRSVGGARSRFFPSLSRRGATKFIALIAVVLIGALLTHWAITSASAQGGGTPGGIKSLTLSWGHPNDGTVTGYQFSTDHGITWSNMNFNSTDEFAHTIRGPNPGSAKVVLLRADGTPGAGVPGGAVVVNPVPTPTPVTAQAQSSEAPVLSARGTDFETITLAWTEPTSGPGTPVAFYELDHSDDINDAGRWVSLATIDATPGRSYRHDYIRGTNWYRVRAVDAALNYGAWSNVVEMTPLEETPNAPVLAARGERPGVIRLTWMIPEGRRGTPPVEFELQWSETGEPDGECETDNQGRTVCEISWGYLTQLSTTDEDDYYYDDRIEPGETRFYRILARDNNWDASEWSNVVSETAPYYPPGAPWVEALAVGSDSVYLRWDVDDDGGRPLLRQELEVSTDNGSYSAVDRNLSSNTRAYVDVGLTAGETKDYRIRACSDAGCGEWGDTYESVTVGYDARPKAPALVAEAKGSTIIALRWTPPTDVGDSQITDFQIQRSDDKIVWADWHRAWYNKLAFEDTGLSGGTTLYYRVQAINSNGGGAWSNVVTVTTDPPGPPAPENLVMTVMGDHEIDLTWEAPYGYTGELTGYRIERVETVDYGALVWELLALKPATDFSHSDTGLYGGTSYSYRVAAYNNAGVGAYSNEVQEHTTGEAVRGQALVLSAEATEPGVITLSWTEPADVRGGEIETYYLERSPDGNDDTWEYLNNIYADRGYGLDQSYDDHGVYGETYYYRIRAEDSFYAYTPWSRTVSATVLHPAPSVSQIYALAAGRNTVHLEWDVHTEEGDLPVTSQKLEVARNGVNYAGLVTLPVPAEAYGHIGLTPGDNMTYRLQACNADGCSWSEYVTVTVGENAVPTAPILTTSVFSSAIIDLTWTVPDDGDEEIVEYEVHTSDDGEYWGLWNFYYDTDRTKFRHYYLEPGTTVHYRVRANNRNGEGLWSSVKVATSIEGAPSAPINFAATAVGEHEVELTWIAPDNADDWTGYQIERLDNEIPAWGYMDYEDLPWEVIAHKYGGSQSFQDTGLYEGTEYLYRILAVNNAGRGPYWNDGYYASVRTDGRWADVPDTPQMLRFVDVSANQVTLEWQAPEHDGGRPITGYEVRVTDYEGCTDEIVRETTSMRITISSLPACTEAYQFAVRAVNMLGAGEWYGLFGRVPTSNAGRVIVTPIHLTVDEGSTSTSSFVVKLASAPTKRVQVHLYWEGDPDIRLEEWYFDDLLLTEENWSTGVTVEVIHDEDDDSENGFAIVHVWVNTADLPPESQYYPNPIPDHYYDPVFDNVSGASVWITERDND